MLKSTIEKGIPLPTRALGGTTTFYVDLIKLLDKLEVSDSILFEGINVVGGYSFTVKVNNVLRIYRIIKKQAFTTKWEPANHNFRVWRVE